MILGTNTPPLNNIRKKSLVSPHFSDHTFFPDHVRYCCIKCFPQNHFLFFGQGINHLPYMPVLQAMKVQESSQNRTRIRADFIVENKKKIYKKKRYADRPYFLLEMLTETLNFSYAIHWFQTNNPRRTECSLCMSDVWV